MIYKYDVSIAKNYLNKEELEKLNDLTNVTIFDIKEKATTELNIETGILKEKCQLQIENARKQ